MTTTFLKTGTAVTLFSVMAVSAFAQSTTTSQTQPVETATATESQWFTVDRVPGDAAVGDFVVGPGRSEIQLQPGQTYVQEISVTNRISEDRVFTLEIEDVKGTADGSNAVQLTGDEVGPYSMRDFISFPENTFTLSLGERARIPVTVSVPANAAPGGYYGSVLVSTVRSAEATDSMSPRSPIIARVGSLFFVTVGGDIVREGETLGINTVGDATLYQTGPIELAILFENTGSVHTNPYGEISISNMFGEEVGFMELEPWFVLPKSLRSREVSWNREFLLGRYTVTARINRGYDNVIDEVSTSFWVVPYPYIVCGFLLGFLLIFCIRFITKNFEFKRRIKK